MRARRVTPRFRLLQALLLLLLCFAASPPTHTIHASTSQPSPGRAPHLHAFTSKPSTRQTISHAVVVHPRITTPPQPTHGLIPSLTAIPAAQSPSQLRLPDRTSAPSDSHRNLPPVRPRLSLTPTRNMAPRAAFAAVVLAAACTLAAADDWSGWSKGRATHYGVNDGMSIHQGSCMFGTLDPNKGTGYDIAAISDKAPDYAGSCGRCYEVACRPSTIKDGYGQNIDRSGACYSGKTVIVTITDTCPCVYPSNAYSNKRWCCGDDYHLDMSNQAFQKIANPGNGVVGVYYRQVSCPGGFSHGRPNGVDAKSWANRGLKAAAGSGPGNAHQA